MKRLILTLFLASSLITAPLMAADANGANESTAVYRTQWHKDMLAGYQSLATQSQALESQAQTYCQSPSSEELEATKRLWLDAFLAWQQVRFIDFGPVEENNRAWQFQFWPDPKNLVARKASYLLKDEAPITPEKIGESGVAVQGFPMVEYLLYDQTFSRSESALPAGRSCQLLVAVTRHIARNGETLANDWKGFQSNYLGSEQYTDTTIRAAMAGLEILEERRLATPMGLRGNGKRSIYSADAWRSGASLIAADASVQGLKKHFMPAFSKLLNDREQTDLAKRIEQQFEEVLANFPELDRPMAPLLSDDNAFKPLQSLYVDLTQLTALVNDRAAVELGVVRGFNSSDGD
ncbi:imelysin family protein [Marinobacter salexigens]|uniref:Imelysin family protein n=1 Tax=Marinobacter salexigens TaxID=1925763 RepID=A0ABS6ABA2_9GAMM|nr:imelysin family protein [Marinobacter salexigens]MBU2874945.1 imelysin family protein [Marinobacter salexigens]